LVAVAATHHHDDLDDLDVVQVTPLELAAHADLVVEAAANRRGPDVA